MKQEFLLLAESAEAVNGKMYMLGGGVERHLAQSFPTQLRADVAMGMLVEWGETNQLHVMNLQIVDVDEKPVVQVEGQIEAGRPPGAKQGQDMRLMLAIRGPFPIERPGQYKVKLTLDNVPQNPPFRFWIEQVEMPGTPGPRKRRAGG
jgi:hypothetical protein